MFDRQILDTIIEDVFAVLQLLASKSSNPFDDLAVKALRTIYEANKDKIFDALALKHAAIKAIQAPQVSQ